MRAAILTLSFIAALGLGSVARAQDCSSKKKEAETACSGQVPGMVTGENGQGGQGTQANSQYNMSLANGNALQAQGTSCKTASTKCNDSCKKTEQEGTAQKNQQKTQEGKDGQKSCQETSKKGDQMLAQAASLLAALAPLAAALLANRTAEANASATPAPAPLTCADPTYAATNPQCGKAGDPGATAVFTTPKSAAAQGPSGGTSTASAPASTVSGSSSSAGPSSSSGLGSGASSGAFGSGSGSSGAGGIKAVAKELSGKPGGDSGLAGGGGGGGGGGFGGGGQSKDADYAAYKKNVAAKNLSGMTIKATDGVTGPLGASIFEKVTKQYQLQKTNMVP